MNRACATLQANVMSLICRQGLKTIEDEFITNPKKRKSNEPEDNQRLIKLINVTKNSNEQARDIFNKCQRTVSKNVAERYSSSQHNLLLRMTKFGEPVSKNKGLSPCIATPDISDLHRELLNKNPVLPTASVSAYDDSVPIESTTNELDHYLDVLCRSTLPPIPSDMEFNTPYEIAAFLSSFQKPYKWKTYYISSFTVMNFMIRKKIVPVQKTTIYNLIDLYVSKCLHQDSCWSLISTPGTKALISVDGFNHLVQFVQDKTMGGFSIPLSEIKTLVEERILFEWRQGSKRKRLPYVSRTTLQKYASRVMTQKVFNILNSITRKTESRHAAKFSIRSTICYAMAVAVLHFLPIVKPYEYHRKKRTYVTTELNCGIW